MILSVSRIRVTGGASFIYSPLYLIVSLAVKWIDDPTQEKKRGIRLLCSYSTRKKHKLCEMFIPIAKEHSVSFPVSVGDLALPHIFLSLITI